MCVWKSYFDCVLISLYMMSFVYFSLFAISRRPVKEIWVRKRMVRFYAKKQPKLCKKGLFTCRKHVV